MNETFEQRIQSIENELKEIRKELEESLARYNSSYKQREYPFTNGYISKFRSGAIGEIPEITVLNADVAFEMLDNPKAPNDKLMKLLEGK